MKKLFAFLLVAVFLPFSAGMFSALSVRAEDPVQWSTESVDDYANDDELLSREELDVLIAPIALYPDPLIAQILPAATFINEIEEAARYLRRKGTAAKIDEKDWDVSVKAVAHYPNVLYMMDEKYDWTVSLGQAYIRQQQEVMDTIQRLRARAKAAGGLVSTPQQQVVVENEVIRVVPAEPSVIYVPVYDPQYLYLDSYYPSYGFMTFGVGFTLGAWLNRDFDWHNHRIYYHGWRGNGWIRRSRPYIHPRNNIYINRNHGYIDYNRRIMQNDTWRYRNNIRRNIYQPGSRPSVAPPRNIIRPRNSYERRSSPPVVTPRTSTAPVTPRTSTAPAPATPQSVSPAIRQGGGGQTQPSVRTSPDGASRQQSAPQTAPGPPAKTWERR